MNESGEPNYRPLPTGLAFVEMLEQAAVVQVQTELVVLLIGGLVPIHPVQMRLAAVAMDWPVAVAIGLGRLAEPGT
jgi:hypothetical protein